MDPYARYSLLAVLAVLSLPAIVTAGCGTDGGSEFGGGNNDPNNDQSSGSFSSGGNGDAGTPPRPCEGLECQQTTCENGGTTSLSGAVYAPNGTLPLYNAIVYVPNAPVDPFPTTGVTCDKCGTTPSGKPVATALSDADGKFTLKNVPVGDKIPLVIQIGKWRRQVTIDTVPRCTDTKLPAEKTRLPRNKKEGDIPKIALTTGGADSLECFFRKLGVDESEFTANTGDGRIHLFNGQRRGATCQEWDSRQNRWEGRDFDRCTKEEIDKDEWTGAEPEGFRIVGVNIDGASKIRAAGGRPEVTLPPATDLWGSTAGGNESYSCTKAGFKENKRCVSTDTNGTTATWPAAKNKLKTYDMVVLSCEGDENNTTKDDDSRKALRDYMDAGGRVFNSHFHYTWFKNPADKNPLNATATWVKNSDRGDHSTRIDKSFAKGEAFAHWLVAAKAATVDGSGNTNSDMTELRKNVSSVPASSRRWIYEPGDSDAVKFYSFNMPLGKGADDQCGRAVYTDIHVSSGDDSYGTFPNNCKTLSKGLSNQEKALLFLMMDLSSCIQDENKPPEAPPPVVR
jgi:hypothetical protein